jgi:DNA-binding transcriptional LysR family regulator
VKLSQCAVLVALADTGSFTRAARELGISQSAVSHAVAALESELDCALVERDRAGVRLNDTGRDVLAHARGMLAHAERIQQAVLAARTGTSGPIRLATSESFSARILPTLMSRFQERFPGHAIDLREGTDQQITSWLRRHAVDIGVVTLPKPDLTTVPLWRDDLVALVPAGHLLARANAVEIGRLADEPLIMPIGGVEPVVRAALRVAGAEPVVRHRMRDLNALIGMVAAGVGVTVLPEWAVPPASPGVRVVRLAPGVPRRVALAIQPASRDRAAVTALVNIATGIANEQSRGRDRTA